MRDSFVRGSRTLGTALANRVRLETRTLAMFRVALGLVLLLDLCLRARNLVAFYTDQGVLPTSALSEFFPAYRYLSVHALSGAVGFQIALFLIAGLAAFALVVGYRTRIATLLSLLLLVSLQARNPMVLNGGDPLLRRLLFWSIFLPLGARWSVDAHHRDGEPRTAVATIASAGLLLQVVFVYLANLGMKLRGDAWLSGEAVERVFELDAFTVLLGEVLAEFPSLLAAANWLWLGLLAASPLLIVLTGRARALLASAFVAMHLGMFLTMHLGVFPLISMVALVPFLGPVLADLRLPSRGERAIGWLASWLPASGRFEPSPSLARTARRVTTVVLTVVLVLLVVLNAVALGYVEPPAGTPDAVTERSWDMFAPAPPGTDVRYVAPATLESGRTIDAFRQAPPRTDPPPDAVGPFPTARWHKYLGDFRAMTPRPGTALGSWLCKQWNRGHDDEMVSVDVTAVVRPAADGVDRPRRTVDLASVGCEG